MEKHPGLEQTGQQQVPMALLQAQAPPQGSDHSATISARALVAALLPGQGRLVPAGFVPAEFVPAEFMLLGLADVYVSQTESRLLPTDELYQTDVNTVGEVMEAFLQGPERQRVQEL